MRPFVNRLKGVLLVLTLALSLLNGPEDKTFGFFRIVSSVHLLCFHLVKKPFISYHFRIHSFTTSGVRRSPLGPRDRAASPDTPGLRRITCDGPVLGATHAGPGGGLCLNPPLSQLLLRVEEKEKSARKLVENPFETSSVIFFGKVKI